MYGIHGTACPLAGVQVIMLEMILIAGVMHLIMA